MSEASSSKRPLKKFSGGYGKYCGIPGCKSATKDSNMEYSMFQIPSKDPDRSRWIKAI